MTLSFRNFALLLCFLFKGLYGFGQWAKLNSGTTQALSNFYSISKDTALIFGAKNTILKTTDQGKTWASFNNGNVQQGAMTRIGTHTFFVNSDYGLINRTDDGGYTWKKITFTSMIFSMIYFKNKGLGYGAGISGLYKTSDSGRHWMATNGPSTDGHPKMIFTSPNKAYYISGNELNKTNDTCKTFQHYLIDQTTQINNFAFSTPKIAYAIGIVGSVFKSIDSGKTWVACHKGISSANELDGLYFFNDSTGYVCGSGGVIYFTKDGGNSWSLQPSGSTETLTDIYFNNKDTGYVVGTNGTILKTINGGFTGIEVVSNTRNIAIVYPNPSGHILNINILSPVIKFGLTIKIVDIKGQTVYQISDKNKDNIKIDLGKLPIGTYYYKIRAYDNGQEYYQAGSVQVLW